MNTLELLQSLEGCKIVKREDGVIEIIPDVESKEAPRFKDGDFMKFNIDDTHYTIIIYDSSDDDYIFAHAAYYNNLRQVRTNLIIKKIGGFEKKITIPAEEEKQLLLDALHKERKIWNPETLQIEEDREPRVGDKCVFWDEGDEDVLVSIYVETRNDEFKHVSNTGPYHCCVRFQDFDFDTMRPKHEK